MNEEVLNASLRKFLKTVGVTSQREIEKAVRAAVADGRIKAADDLRDWIGGAVAHGGMRTDAIILAQAHAAQSDAARLQELADLALALTAPSERHAETTLTGEAFTIAARAWPSDVFARLPQPCPYPVAVGAIAGAQGISPGEAQARSARESAQNRVLEPEELAGMATLLASADGGGITGQVISVDGGYRL